MRGWLKVRFFGMWKLVWSYLCCCGLLLSFSQPKPQKKIKIFWLIPRMLHPAPACPLNMSQVQCQALGEDLPPPVASQEADRCPRFWWSALPSRAGPVKDGELNPPVLKCSEVFEIHTLLFNMCIYIYIYSEWSHANEAPKHWTPPRNPWYQHSSGHKMRPIGAAVEIFSRRRPTGGGTNCGGSSWTSACASASASRFMKVPYVRKMRKDWKGAATRSQKWPTRLPVPIPSQNILYQTFKLHGLPWFTDDDLPWLEVSLHVPE